MESSDSENNVDLNGNQQSEMDTQPESPEEIMPHTDDPTLKSAYRTFARIKKKYKIGPLPSKASTSKEPPYYNDLLFMRPMFRKDKVNIFTEPKDPRWHDVHGPVVTRPLIPTKIPEAFEALPIFGSPSSNKEIPEFENNKIREFVGSDLNEEQFARLANYCSPECLKTGNEIKITNLMPTPWALLPSEAVVPHYEGNSTELCIMKKYKLRVEKDRRSQYVVLKYRGCRMAPVVANDYSSTDENLLVPGKDLLFRVRIYRPYLFGPKEKNSKKRHSMLSHDVFISGRQTLADLRKMVECANDLDLRIDVSASPDDPPTACAKDLFPAGFMFVNNVFYTDRRPGVHDISEPLRAWALARGMGQFPCEDMATCVIQDMVHVLGHPEVYVHQGSCEHVFIFSEVRLVTHRDPLRLSAYPHSTMMSQYHTIYCTTCAEFGAKWVVTGCARVPFDPAYFCDPCFRLYLYKDGKKLGDFKAYSYIGNDLNVGKTT